VSIQSDSIEKEHYDLFCFLWLWENLEEGHTLQPQQFSDNFGGQSYMNWKDPLP
jgi:hypothetical protein